MVGTSDARSPIITNEPPTMENTEKDFILQITRISLRQIRCSSASTLFTHDDIFVRLVSEKQVVYQTLPSNASSSDVWREWNLSLNIAHLPLKFSIQAMCRHTLRPVHKLGYVAVTSAELLNNEVSGTQEKGYAMVPAKKNGSLIEVMLYISGISCTESKSHPTATTKSDTAPQTLEVLTTQPNPELGPSFTQTESDVNRGGLVAEGLHALVGMGTVSAIVDGIVELQGPVQSALATADALSSTIACLGEAVKYMDSVVGIVKTFTDLHPISQVAFGILSKVYEIVKDQKSRDDSIKDLASAMRDMLEVLASLKDLQRIALLRSVIKFAIAQVDDCAQFIIGYTSHGFWGRVIRQAWTSHAADTALKFQNCFTTLTNRLGLAVGVQTLDSAEALKKLIDDDVEDLRKDLKQDLRNISKMLTSLADDDLLDKLPRAKGADYDVGLRCLEGTRTDILNQILQWIDCKEPHSNIFWLHAIAGSGKSTIASTVSLMSDGKKSELGSLGLGSLGAAFFCKRNVDELSQPTLIIPTIASRLAHAYPPLKGPILAALRSNSDVGTSPIRTQFRKLIVDPLSALCDLDVPPVIIVIDALDESGNEQTRKSFLQCLTAREDVSRLPAWFKLFVTSRPEPDIKKHLDILQFKLEVDVSSEDNIHDITAYTKYLAGSLQEQTEGEWLGPNAINELVMRACGLFIWIKISFDYIAAEPSPRKALADVLSQIPPAGFEPQLQLDSLYYTVLGQNTTSTSKMNLIRSVLGCIVVASVPLSVSALSDLLGYETSEVMWVINKLASVLPIHLGVIHVIHQSFVDFLIDRQSEHPADAKRARDFYVDTSEHILVLARACLRTMNFGLHRDLCQIGDPSLLNNEVPEKQKQEHLREGLVYSCRYWADHVRSCFSQQDDISSALTLLFTEHLLEWFEVLSLAGNLNDAIRALRTLEACLKESPSDRTEQLYLWCYDATRFLQYHFQLVRQSALHIYISALAFTPKKTWISQHYGKKYPPLLHIPVGLDDGWSRCLVIFTGHEAEVKSCSFSPDGKQVVSGSDDGVVLVWDAESGNLLISLEAHHTRPSPGSRAYVNSVAFSPIDGKHLASGSDDYFARVWETETGTLLVSLEHSCEVKSVAFSPDGRHLASGASDSIVRIWDIETGTTIYTLEDHHDVISSVIFSSNGQLLVSCSHDGSIRVWDTSTRSVVRKLEGQEDKVLSIAFDSDMKRLAFGVKGVRIWDLDTGTVSLLKDSSDLTCACVSFSADGKQLAAGFRDSPAILVWDLESATILHRLPGHGNAVSAIEFSRVDSSLLVSCADDATARIWDTVKPNLTCDLVDNGQPFSSTFCLEFSPDGRYLADCGSSLVLWHTETGRSVTLIQDSEVLLSTPVFSPDGKYLAIGCGNVVHMWNSETTDPNPFRSFNGNTQLFSEVCFSPSGNELAGTQFTDRSVLVWDTVTGAITSDPNFDTTPSWVIAFSWGPASTLDFTRLEEHDDGWIYGVLIHQGKEVENGKRLCYLPPYHRDAYFAWSMGFGTRVATVSYAAARRLTIVDLSLLYNSVH